MRQVIAMYLSGDTFLNPRPVARIFTLHNKYLNAPIDSAESNRLKEELLIALKAATPSNSFFHIERITRGDETPSLLHFYKEIYSEEDITPQSLD